MALSPIQTMICVVDDDPDVLGSLQFLLETDGFDVRTYKSGAALLGDEASDHADCFVIDYKMPDLNGLDLVRRLRRLFPQARLFAMYGLTEAFRSTFLDPQLIDSHPTSMGKAIPHAEILVVNDAGQIAANLNRTIKRVDDLLAAVQEKNGTLHDLIYRDDGSKLVSEVKQLATDLAAMVGEVRRGRGSLHSLIYDDQQNLIADLAATARVLRTLAEETGQGKGTLGQLTQNPDLYNALRGAADRLDKALLELQLTLEKYKAEGIRLKL